MDISLHKLATWSDGTMSAFAFGCMEPVEGVTYDFRLNIGPWGISIVEYISASGAYSTDPAWGQAQEA